MNQKIYQMISSLLAAINNCEKMGNYEWEVIHHEKIEKIVSDHLPSGSGFDGGTSLNFDLSKPERLVFDTAFHHMDSNGYYCGWSHHQVVVKPSLAFGKELRITGLNRNDIKDYIHEVFDHALDAIYPQIDVRAA